jgi:protein SCO1/2
VSSQVFTAVQSQLGPQRDKVHLVSISIDPEFDTPARLVEYATRWKAGAGWSHYTGSVADSIAMQKAFGAYRGDKMNHLPVTFVRNAPGTSWVRLDGFATPAAIVATLQPSK